MLLNTILRILDQQSTQPGSASAAKSRAPSDTVEKIETFSKVVETVKTPASAATFEAAAEAKGMKKIELEIAAAAGLLRPMSPKLPAAAGNKSEQSFEELRRTIEELEKPNQSHSLDLFE